MVLAALQQRECFYSAGSGNLVRVNGQKDIAKYCTILEGNLLKLKKLETGTEIHLQAIL